MRFFLLLILFNLSCFNYAFSQKINIENRVILDVPDKFIFIEGNVNSELIEPLLFFVGESPKSYLIGTKESVEFTREYQDNPDDVFQEIVTKMEQKNIKSQSSAEKFVAKELTKLFKKKKYEGVIWLIFGESKIDQIDYEFSNFIDELKKMDDTSLKKEMISYQKEWKKLTKEAFGDLGKYAKISKLIIKKNNFNDPIFQFSMNYKIKGLQGKVIFYGFIKDNKPIGLIYECVNVCPKKNNSLEKIVSPTFLESNILKTNSPENKIETSSNVVEQLQKLNDLYKSGVLTKEEFEKAKKKILN